MKTFDALPLAVILDSPLLGRYFCVHGGISPQTQTLEAITNYNRLREPLEKELMGDLLWSDPIEEDPIESMEPEELKEWYDIDFCSNATRGAGFVFGVSGLMKFMDQNNVAGIIRAHEVQHEGFLEHHFGMSDPSEPDEATPIPLVSTVFSAPNYCDMYANKASVLYFGSGSAELSLSRFSRKSPELKKWERSNFQFMTFKYVPHPFYLPNFMNGISYSIPFIAENLAKLWTPFLKMLKNAEDEEA